MKKTEKKISKRQFVKYTLAGISGIACAPITGLFGKNPVSEISGPSEKLWKWRDLYDHGYIDDLGYGVDNPFINNMHYVKNDINFYLRNEQLHKIKTDGVEDFGRRNLIC